MSITPPRPLEEGHQAAHALPTTVAGSNSELQAATYKLASTPYKVQSSLGKSKVMMSTIR